MVNQWYNGSINLRHHFLVEMKWKKIHPLGYFLLQFLLPEVQGIPSNASNEIESLKEKFKKIFRSKKKKKKKHNVYKFIDNQSNKILIIYSKFDILYP
jgi:hypothetical protein